MHHATACHLTIFLLCACAFCLRITLYSVPQPKDWSISMNKKERRLALATALQSAASDVVVVDSITQAAGGCSLAAQGMGLWGLLRG